MLVENVLVRYITYNFVQVSWTSDSPETKSWLFLNGLFLLGPFFGETMQRSIRVKVPTTTFLVEVHDFGDDTVPDPITIPARTRPQISWNSVENAACYRVYHKYLAGDATETLLREYPPLGERIIINCPVKLERCWSSFRVVAVDEYGNESESDTVSHFAADFPVPPNCVITRDTQTNLLTFKIEEKK
ncbi:MAG: hypothetical protein ACRC2T_19995 [Thermoguttaceae bacterium]